MTKTLLTTLTAIVVLSTAILGTMQINQRSAIDEIHVLVNENFNEMKVENADLRDRVETLIEKLNLSEQHRREQREFDSP